MARLPMISGDEFVRALGKAGYVWDHTEGSHMILLHPSRADSPNPITLFPICVFRYSQPNYIL